MTSVVTRHRPARPGLVRIHLGLIVLTTLLAVGGAAAAYFLHAKTYTATGAALVNPKVTQGTPILPEMGTESSLASSGVVARLAAGELGVTEEHALERLTANVPVDTTVLELSYSAQTPERAVRGADAFLRAYVDYRNGRERARLVEVVTPPQTPTEPDRPSLVLVLAVAVLAGLTLGVVGAVAWDRLRGRLRGPDDLTAHTGLPILANIPRSRTADGALALSNASRRAFGYLAVELTTLLENKRRGVVVVVTSPRRGAGVTTVTVNAAVAFAKLGREVIVVSADVRRPGAHEVFGHGRAPGLTELLSGASEVETAVRGTDVPGLRILTAGASPDGSARFDLEDLQLLLARLSAMSIVVVEAPPLLEAPEAMALVDRADVALLVTDVGHGERADAAEAVDLLSRTAASRAGAVANRPTRGARRRATAQSLARRWRQGAEAEADPHQMNPTLVDDARKPGP